MEVPNQYITRFNFSEEAYTFVNASPKPWEENYKRENFITLSVDIDGERDVKVFAKDLEEAQALFKQAAINLKATQIGEVRLQPYPKY